MTITYKWRGDVRDAELNTLHAEAFGHEVYPDDEWNWTEQLGHSLGWVCARDGDELVGFVNVPWDGVVRAFVLDTMVAASHGRRGIGTELVAVAVTEARRAGASGCTSTSRTTCDRSTSTRVASYRRTRA